MGGITFFLFLVEALTGVLLMFYYRPTMEWAFYDIQALRDVQTLGIMREIHRWACSCHGDHGLAAHVSCLSDGQLQATS